MRTQPLHRIVGYTLDVPGRERLTAGGVCAGRVTNNEAEYTALGKGLVCVRDLAGELSGHRLVVCGDSQVVINQVRGEWRCHQPRLAALCKRVGQLCAELEAAGFPPVVFEWVPRERNTVADAVSVAAWEAATGRTMPVRVGAKSEAMRPLTSSLVADDEG